MTENRVRVKDYGRLSATDPRLIPIASIPGKTCKLHYLAAAAFTAMCAACYIGTGIRLVAASGWRAHRWKSCAEYDAYLIAHYGSVDKGRKWVAFDSPHETGLAVDFGSGGLTPDRDTAQTQKLTLAYRWLRDKAHIYGWTPYLREPWHWEFHISLDDWRREA
jgi:LAS superfamily LD-carboxypeptidase LdcB